MDWILFITPSYKQVYTLQGLFVLLFPTIEFAVHKGYTEEMEPEYYLEMI